MNFDDVELKQLFLKQNLATANNRATNVLFVVFFQIRNTRAYYMRHIHVKEKLPKTPNLSQFGRI